MGYDTHTSSSDKMRGGMWTSTQCILLSTFDIRMSNGLEEEVFSSEMGIILGPTLSLLKKGEENQGIPPDVEEDDVSTLESLTK